MAKGFWVKNHPTSSWKTVKNLYVKISPSTWVSVNDAWVKVKQAGTGTWQRFWASATNPDTPIEILTDFTSPGQLLRLQGKNYHWTPTPSTLFYKFTWVDNATSTTYTLTSSTSTSNPASGSSITLPGSSTYRTISKNTADNEFAVGGLSTYKFTVTGALSNGLESVASAEYSMRTPAAPEIAVEVLSGTSLKLTITPASTADGDVTGRYIVYTSDAVGGLIESGGGRGGYAYGNPKVVTLTGLTAGREYDIYVAPFTGTSGSTTANATGYAGAEGYANSIPVSDYSFSFGNILHVGTNGYISLDSGNTADAISSTTGKVLGILPGDLYQDTTTSVWYWSDANKFIIRWEGYHYNQPSNLRQYEVTFTKDTNYVTVYPINVANTTEGTEAYVKNGVALTSYAAALGTGSWRTVYFDPTVSPANLFGPYVPKSKSVMKQVTGLTAGTQDQGYTSITTSINQNQVPTLGAFDVSSFTKGTVSSSSQGAARSTTLTWGSSTDATRYEIQYQGSNDNTNWTTVQTYAQSLYNTGTSESKTWSTSGGDFTYYTFMRANIRASESTATSAYVYSNSGTYFEATGVAPGQPTFNTINKTATTISIQVDAGSQGSNYRYEQMEYMYRTDAGTYGSTWSSQTLSSGAGTISLTGLTGGTKYWIKIRNRNYDELYSPENETNVTTVTAPTLLTGVKRSINTGTTFTNTSTTMYISTNGYIAYGNNTPASISIPTTGYVLNIFGPNDLSQTTTGGVTIQASYKNTDSYFVVSWKGRYLGSSTETLEYEARFYWNSDLVEVNCITNNLTALHYQSDNAVYNNGSATKTWATNSSSIASWTSDTGLTTAGAPTASDDGYTAITATKPLPPKSAGTKRIIPLGITVTSGSTIAYVSTNGFIGLNSDPSSAISIPSTGRYLNIFQSDLRQANLYVNATSTTYSIRYSGYQLGNTAQTAEYEIKFTFGSTSAEVYIIANNLPNNSSDTVLTVDGVGINTWSGTNASTMTSVATTANTTQDGVDDARTAITLTAPLLNLTTNPAYGAATSSSAGFTASITTAPNPTGGTYSVVSQTAGTATVNSSTGALTVSGLTASQSSTATIRYSLSGYNSVDITRNGSASAAALNLTTNPAYGAATSTSDGFTASITTAPNPTGGTYSVVSQTAGTATVNSSTGALTVTGLTASSSSTATIRYSLSGYNSVDITRNGSASAAATVPGAPSSASIGTLTYAGSYISTLLNPWQSGNATKLQTWTYDSTVTFPVTYTAGSGADSHEFYMSSSSTTPTTQSATHTSNPTAIQTDRGTITRYIWVRARNAQGVSAWVSAGSKTSVATVVSGLAIKICRAGTTTCSNGVPSSQNALSYSYTSVNTSYAHDAYVSATVSGAALSASY